jgi:hypothetical protein
VTGPAAGGPDLLEGGVDLARDPMLRVELEAKETDHRDDDCGNQARQDSYHSVCSGCGLCRGEIVILSDGPGLTAREVTDSMIYSGKPLLMGAQADVASRRLHVHHIRPNLLENRPLRINRRNKIQGWKRGSTHVV